MTDSRTTRRRALLSGLAVLGAISAPAQAHALGDLLRGILTPRPRGAGGFATEGEMSAAVRQALSMATDIARGQLGAPGAFWRNARFRIPLPDPLDDIQAQLARVRLSEPFDDLQRRMNQAAERAIPEAARLTQDAIRALTIRDVANIVYGREDAATAYLRQQTEPAFAARLTPIINAALADAGAWRALSLVAERAQMTSVSSGLRNEIERSVRDRTMNAFYAVLAAEEAAIRRDPARQTTRLLKKVFGY